MTLWLFERLKKVSSNYHEGGGLVVVAASLERALALVAAAGDIEVPDWSAAKIYALRDDAEECLIVFPDAGCC